MPRQIFAEEQQDQQEQQVQQDGIAQGQSGATQAANLKEKTSRPIEGDGDQVTIKSDELQKLFHEWDAQGHTDLSVNNTLATRIEEYLAYQDQMDPLREKLAKRIYKPYICGGESKVNLTLSVNDKELGIIGVFAVKSHYKIIYLSDFRSILIALGNPYAKWIKIEKDNEVGIDIEAYMLDNGGKCEIDVYSSSCIKITL